MNLCKEKRNEIKDTGPLPSPKARGGKIFSPLPRFWLVKNSAAAKTIYIVGVILALFVPLYSYFLLEIMYFGAFSGILDLMGRSAGAVAFSLLILYGIYGILWLIVKKGWIASLIFIGLVSLLGTANYFKHTLTGDFVYPWDLVNQTGNIGILGGFVKTGLPLKFVLIMLSGGLLTAVIFITHAEICVKFPFRAAVAVMVAAAMFFPLCTAERITKTLDRFNMTVNSTAEQETNHIVNGFTGGFLVNLLSMNISKPDGYSKEKIAEIMAPYEDVAAADDFSKPDIIIVLSESFWDAKLLPGTEFSENPIANFEEIAAREGSVSGYMYQTAFGGGTVRTEFEVLTGLTSDYIPSGAVPWQYIFSDIPTYASVYKDMGYRTVMLHTYIPTFYSRQKVYPYLGFDEMYFQNELTGIEDVPWYISGNYISDDSFVSYIEYMLDRSGGRPGLIFGISMENHQPYEGKYETSEIKVSNPAFSENTRYAVENYATGLKMADNALKKLVDYIDKRDRDTVLIYFGDHLPTLGENKAAYKESGFIASSDEIRTADWPKIMRTPFLIYGNFDLKESDILKEGGGNEISSYNLLNGAAELIGAPQTVFMRFLADYHKEAPYYNVRLRLKTSREAEEFINAHKLITYDLLNGGKYITE